MGYYMFDDEDADFILRSSHPKVDFRVHRAIVAVASPPLAGMLGIPQPSHDESSRSTPKETPYVEVSEDSTTLRTLLQLIYPIADRPTANTFSTIDDLISVFESAFKYDVDAAIVQLRMILIAPKWLESSPLRVYAVAMRWDLEDEAKVASKYTLRECLYDSPLLRDFNHTSGYALQRLVALHRTRSTAASELLTAAVVPSSSCRYCGATPPPWIVEWKRRAKEEMSSRPTTEVVFSLKFFGEIWSSAVISTDCKNGRDCENYKLWTPSIGAFFNQLKAKIDALPATI
jgi:hypothetical protein